MMPRKVLTILAAVIYAMSVYSQPAFYSKRIAYIARQTGLNIPSSLPTYMDDDSTFTYQNRALRIRTNRFGDVTHIGYRIFPNGLNDNYCLPLYDFVERYLLELDLPSDDFTPSERMELDHVVLSRGTLKQLKEVTPDTPFSFEEIERRMFRLIWKAGNDSISLTVPADYQLIAGANTIELEDIFERDIVRYPSVPSDTISGHLDDETMISSNGYKAIRVGEFLSPDIRSDVYMKEEDGQTCMLIDERKPIISITNVILTACHKEILPLTLTINRYGGKRTKIHVSMQQLISYLRNEGCQLYVGVKSFDKSEMQASLYAYQPHMAYNHLVSLTVPTKIIRGGAAELHGVVYTYIPLHNVTERFFNQGFE